MAYHGTNLVPSSQADSCSIHGFAVAEVGPSSLLCLFAKCGAAFPDAEALDLHMKGHDFGNVRLSDRAISDTFIGYGTSSGYGVDTYVGDIAMDNCTGYVDSSGPFENSVGATPYVGHDYNPAYATAPSVGNIVGPGPGTGPWMPLLPPNTQAPHATAGPPAHLGPRRSVCTHPNCNRSFGRPSDLARHAKKYELNPVKYSCPVPGCQYVGSCGFLRHDKLLSHGRNTHGMEL